jgi:hypothetical protein
MLCPLNRGHRLVEIAEGLYQCPKCGSGPRDGGRFPFWAISCVEMVGHDAEALAVRYDQRLDIYVSSWLQWAIDGQGAAIAGSVSQELVEYLSTPAEKAEGYLPATTRSGSGCSRELSDLMFRTPLGEKVIRIFR